MKTKLTTIIISTGVGIGLGIGITFMLQLAEWMQLIPVVVTIALFIFIVFQTKEQDELLGENLELVDKIGDLQEELSNTKDTIVKVDGGNLDT